MLEPRCRWIFPQPVTIDPAMIDAGGRLGLSARAVELLVRRGVATDGDLGRWLGPARAGLHDPKLLPDAAIVEDRIARARAGHERVMVFGDFDADGLTGLSILTLAFRRLGLDVRPYVPSRVDEGHGLSMAAVDAARTDGVSLIVTVDCGSTSVVEIAAAARAGIDTIVTDHHRVPDRLPPAVAIVNPHRRDGTYPDPRLSGSGVAFKLAQLLLASEPDGPAAALGFADLAMIGTVADVAPIVGENRAIARLGLEVLRSRPRPGLAALLSRANADPGEADLGTIGFAIAPRINAAGRVGEALDAARLLLTDDRDEAATLAETLETANLNRRDLTKGALAEARAAITDAEAPAIVVRGPWPVGIVGLVAGRLAEELGRPAVVGSELGEDVRASCRGDGGLDLAAALGALSDLFTRFGGHAGAAGFELPAAHWDAFRERFLRLAAAVAPADLRPVLAVDVALPARSVDYPFLRELTGLAPCGPGNPEPLVAVLGMTVTRVRAVTGGHTQLTLKRHLDVLDGIAFGWAELAELVTEGDRLDVVARLSSRKFGGLESLQLEIRDAASSGSHPGAAAILEAAGIALDATGVAAAAVPA